MYENDEAKKAYEKWLSELKTGDEVAVPVVAETRGREKD